ncbi:MAG: class I SAM-dependent methyltransferase [Proteobacteria bacterium]|nr:class I SAM-dependent methyltransferase [Pseudomonadota bacterium]
MVNISDIENFWTRGDIYSRVRQAMSAANLDNKNLDVEELFPIDQYHARGIAATIDLGKKMPISENQKILDIGCGLGGPARYYAKEFKCHITGIDITPSFIEIGNEFNRLTSMSSMIDLYLGNGEKLEFEDEVFDGAYSQHVTMNVSSRINFFSEAYRVLKKNSFFAFTEHGLGPKGDPIFPLPWADNSEMSFLLTPENTISILKDVGFIDIEIFETGDKYIQGYEKLIKGKTEERNSVLGIHVIGGPTMKERSSNSMQSIKENRTLPFEIICKKN